MHYSGLGVVLDCIASWFLPPYSLLYQDKLSDILIWCARNDDHMCALVFYITFSEISLIISAATRDFQQCGILLSVDSDEP